MEHFLAQKTLTRYALHLQDFGGPVGFRIADRILAFTPGKA
ncbi:hypothetical protein LJR289_000549 [Pseudoduganella sp. LjRoot289]